MNKLLLTLIAFSLLSCSRPDPFTGNYRGVIESPGGELAFPLIIEKEANTYSAKVINGADTLYFSRVDLMPDSFALSFEFFDSHLNGHIDEEGNLSGLWTRTFISKNDTLPFYAEQGVAYRYPAEDINSDDLEGEYQVEFKGKGFSYEAMGYFVTQEQGRLLGTFITEYGDFRFLEGVYTDSSFVLSTFDGAHAFYFEGKQLKDGSLEGQFWSRGNPVENWTAVPGNHNLRDPLTIAAEQSIGKDLEFEITALDGKTLTQDNFKDKPVLLYVFGSWCPNCADQAELLAEYAKELYEDTDLEIIGIAFEYTGDEERDKRQIDEYRKRFDIPWTLSLGGITSKRVAARSLPFTDQVVSFPSTYFADRNHKIRAVHVGFNGPATGSYYFKERERFKNKIDEILADQ